MIKPLAKAAEERYQSAAGLERDLRRCLADWECQRRIDDFPLGQNDTPDRLLFPETLYGRKREVATLLAAFDRSARKDLDIFQRSVAVRATPEIGAPGQLLTRIRSFLRFGGS